MCRITLSPRLCGVHQVSFFVLVLPPLSSSLLFFPSGFILICAHFVIGGPSRDSFFCYSLLVRPPPPSKNTLLLPVPILLQSLTYNLDGSGNYLPPFYAPDPPLVSGWTSDVSIASLPALLSYSIPPQKLLGILFLRLLSLPSPPRHGVLLFFPTVHEHPGPVFMTYVVAIIDLMNLPPLSVVVV